MADTGTAYAVNFKQHSHVFYVTVYRPYIVLDPVQLQIDVQDNDAQLCQSHALITALVFQQIGPQGPFSHRPGPAPAQCGGGGPGAPRASCQPRAQNTSRPYVLGL